MANYVTTRMTFENVNKESLDTVMKIYQNSINKEDNGVVNGRNFVRDLFGEESLVEFWNTVGSKWIEFDEFYESDNDLTLSCTSAWSFPKEFVDNLYEKLKEFGSGENLYVWANFEDEMPNFVGYYGRYEDEETHEEIAEDEYEDIVGCMPYILNEEGEWEDSNEDWWEKLSDWQNDCEKNFKDYAFSY